MNDDNLKISDLSEEQIYELIEARGRKLGILIGTSPLDDAVKADLMNVVQYATIEQLDNLIKVFEDKFCDVSTYNVNKNLEEAVKKIQSDYEKQSKRLQAETMKKISSIERQIKSASKKA